MNECELFFDPTGVFRVRDITCIRPEDVALGDGPGLRWSASIGRDEVFFTDEEIIEVADLWDPSGAVRRWIKKHIAERDAPKTEAHQEGPYR